MQTSRVVLDERCDPVTVFARRRRFLLGATVTRELGIPPLARLVRLAAVCLRPNVLSVWWLCLLGPVTALGVPASPLPYQVKQPDGTVITLYIRGDEDFNWEEDVNGYTVVRDNTGAYVYATLNAQANLAPTDLVVGRDDPGRAGLRPKTLPPPERRVRPRAQALGAMQQLPNAGGVSATATVGTVKNVVIMMRFSDHVLRPISTQDDINTVFNNVGAPPWWWSAHFWPWTGSVKELYWENSYGQLTLESSVFGWFDLPQTEQYYADGVSGLGSKIQEAITDALNLADASIDFSLFDGDGDGFVDAITFIHSGYAAEHGGLDFYLTNFPNRIWSHYWAIPGWTSAEGVKVSPYTINPGVWLGLFPPPFYEPGRIGVICHETGHFFGLPDLYDTDGSSRGAGSYCMMANSWGFTGDQLNPPHFSAWCKLELGWATPIPLSYPSGCTARRVEEHPDIFGVYTNYPPGEYLLIENRQPWGFESTMPQGGLCVWHIDEGKGDNTDEGFPGQPGWPGNNRHYKVALLQPDGNYDLERNVNSGDGGDVYNPGGVTEISAFTVPNTDSYQGGTVFPTFNRIYNVGWDSGGSGTMDFEYDPPWGACCDMSLPGGVCHDWPVSWCDTTNPQIRFFKAETCANVEARGDCAEHTGACCDMSLLGGACRDNVPGSLCDTSNPQIKFFKAESCAVVEARGDCLEHTGACCYKTSGTCVDNVPESLCPVLPGGLTASVGAGACSACGPGAHWADACPAGDDTMDPTGALVGISTDPASCAPNTNLVLSGPVTVHRQAGSPHDIDTEIVSMSLTGGNITLTAGAGQQQGPGLLLASIGMITELPPDFDVALSYFEVFFEVDLGGGMFVYNQAALRIEANITCVPPQAVYIHPTGCLPLFTAGGMHVANLVTARHITFPDQFRWEKGVSCAALDPPCIEHTGACCDGTTGVCTDDVPASRCPTSAPQVRWEKGVSCADLNPPCAEHTGACCDIRIADDTLRCRDDVPESGCVIDDPDQVSWYKFTRCAHLPEPCLEHTGACCDEDTFGSCQDNVPASHCDRKKCLFYKDTPCSEIECTHNAIPTVSEWGLVIMTLLLLTGAKVYFGRRSQAATSR